MSIYHILVINRAGSLIFDWENKQIEPPHVERTFPYPLGVTLELIDQKPTVVFGARDGIQIRYTVSVVNGRGIKANRFTLEDGGDEIDFMKFTESPENFPMKLKFSPPVLSANEKIILSSMFHSLYTIAAQLSPVCKSSGIEVLETTQFRLHCFQSITGVKFIVVGSTALTQNLDTLLRKIYELYSDFALKNPFYSIDMPIRAEKFDEAIKNLLEAHEKSASVTL
ncbi:sybindin-like family domain-containing protein [Ditylenchus destructor]|uniref:Trafficking protein particle complex subunit n=1 Tax=Ditylenchus destructor TaxID=166010 RepID=A0AAD4N2Y1_9BILA|nr:sybindin-like family domain-containing protein [Ditylenchus destructor]